jgi:Nif-specific regulatory protein
VIGTLGAVLPSLPRMQLEKRARLFSTIAAMLAQAIGLRQIAQQERQKLVAENERLQSALEQRFRPANIIGSSHAMQPVYDMIGRVSGSDASVLILGESGVGKELIAHATHFNSPRAKGPFIKVNCAALPQSVLESELFGHEQGAFTGATRQRKGRFELAHRGTIFLDEIGDLPATTQIMLLRVLQERQFERVGGSDTVTVDVRVITATNRDLEALVAENSFRSDLYYRLNVVAIRVPPLGERVVDVRFWPTIS